jgi:hypothetical protein
MLICAKNSAILSGATESLRLPTQMPLTPEERAHRESVMAHFVMRYEALEAGRPVRNRRWRLRLKGLLPLDQLRGLPPMHSSVRKPGVYFLWIGPALWYVGRSVDVGNRYDQHRERKHFTHATYIPFHREWISHLEPDYVRRYRPPNNRTSHG